MSMDRVKNERLIQKELFIMKIGFCQYDVRKSDIEENLRIVESMLEHTDADLMVLPELAFTGYSFKDKESLMALSDEKTVRMITDRLQALSKKTGAHIVAGMAESEKGRLYNAAYLIGPKGLIGKQRKINLTKNETIFDRGTELSVFEVNGVKIGISICFDTWFPESARILCEMGAKIICSPANFGGPWTLDVAKVRALENSVHVVLANRSGFEVIDGEDAHFRGESRIVDAGGNVLVEAKTAQAVTSVPVTIAEKKANLICDDMEAEKEQYVRYVRYDT